MSLCRSPYDVGCRHVLALYLGRLGPWVLSYIGRVFESYDEADIMENVCTVTQDTLKC